MELLTIVITSLLTLISPAGLIIDRIAGNTLESQVENIEKLAVRIDNAPSFQILSGKVERIRIAARGVEVIPGVKIAVIELETEPLEVNLKHLQGGEHSLPESLEKPLQGGVRLVLTEAELNQALQSEAIQSQLEKLINQLVPQRRNSPPQTYQLINTSVELINPNRLGFQVQLRFSDDKEEKITPVEITLEFGLKLLAGRKFKLNEPVATLNGRKLSTRLLEGFAQGLDESLDLAVLEDQGITARLLKFTIDDEAIHLAGFFRVEPSE